MREAMRFKFFLYTLILTLCLVPAPAKGLFEYYDEDRRWNGWGEDLWNGWVDLDLFVAWRTKRPLPPLLTTSPDGTAPDDAGVLNLPTTEILVGNQALDRSPQLGLIGDFGIWTTPTLAVGGGFTSVMDEDKHYRFTSGAAGLPILALPFVDVDLQVQSVQLLSFPGLFTDADVNLLFENSIWCADVYGRYRLCVTDQYLFDLIGGWYYSMMKDSVDYQTSTVFGGLALINVADSFHTRNQYNAGMVGGILDWQCSWWGASLVGKLAVGNMSTAVYINGFTEAGGAVTEGGILTGVDNIGTHRRNKVEVVPEVHLKLRFTPHPRIGITAGYMVTYWPSVAFAANQISQNLDPTGIQPVPTFNYKSTDYWLHGTTVGIHFIW